MKAAAKVEHCPACGVLAYYDPYEDRFQHADGSSNVKCIVAVLRGEVKLEERPDLLCKFGPRPSPTITDLYRYFNDCGRLLYVGISLSAVHRATKHRREKHWWNEVATITVEHWATREDALEAERLAIIHEYPVYNIVHNR